MSVRKSQSSFECHLFNKKTVFCGLIFTHSHDEKIETFELGSSLQMFYFIEFNVIINVAYPIIVLKSIFYCQNELSTFSTVITKAF